MVDSANFFYRLTLSYDGRQYLGWQVQESQGKTVQGELNSALRRISKSDEIHTIGSGRTDAGVHARGQVVRAEMPLHILPEALVRALNAHLPDDIRILNAEISSADFHPTFGAKSKYYSYFFTLESWVDPLLLGKVSNCDFSLDMDLCQRAAEKFVGTHDFQNYFCVGTAIKTTVRTIYACDVLSHPSHHPLLPKSTVYELRIHGSGFLKQMVRLIMGTIWNVGRGKVGLADLELSLREKLPKQLAPVAPPDGLYLMQVVYE